MLELKIITDFAAAHQLKSVAKKCENMHGHNWKIEVCVTGEKTDVTGVLIDFTDLKKYVKEIVERLDHQYLNALDFFDDAFPPSSENVAVYIATQLTRMLSNHPTVTVLSVTAWESNNAAATYYPTKQQGHIEGKSE